MSKVLIGIIYVIWSIVFICILILINYMYEKKRWNNGYCKCGGKLIFLEKDYEHDCRWYACNKCNKQIDLTWFKLNGENEDGRSKNNSKKRR